MLDASHALGPHPQSDDGASSSGSSHDSEAEEPRSPRSRRAQAPAQLEPAALQQYLQTMMAALEDVITAQPGIAAQPALPAQQATQLAAYFARKSRTLGWPETVGQAGRACPWPCIGWSGWSMAGKPPHTVRRA